MQIDYNIYPFDKKINYQELSYNIYGDICIYHNDSMHLKMSDVLVFELYLMVNHYLKDIDEFKYKEFIFSPMDEEIDIFKINYNLEKKIYQFSSYNKINLFEVTHVGIIDCFDSFSKSIEAYFMNLYTIDELRYQFV